MHAFIKQVLHHILCLKLFDYVTWSDKIRIRIPGEFFIFLNNIFMLRFQVFVPSLAIIFS
jgi:hypothetical protein